ncbi:MAG: hypothetical protein ACE5OZ_00305 [Candidatus Heimdallarchaeota archaeon]
MGFVIQAVPSISMTMDTTSISSQEDLILPLEFTPLELRKPVDSYSWIISYEDVEFRVITKLVVELKPLDHPGRLEILDIVVTINGVQSSQSFADEDNFFDAPSQIGMLVDTSSRKIDGTTDILIRLKPEWSFSDAGIKIILAQLVSFNPRPSFGEGFQKVPLLSEWNAYQFQSIPPLSLYFTTVGFLGNASDSNRLQLSIYVEIIGAEEPWFELFLGDDQLYQGNAKKRWINITADPKESNGAVIPLALEYHPHRTMDRHKQITFHLEVYAEFDNYVDPEAAEREQILEEMPRISELMGGILTMNAIFLPLLVFRRRRLEERKKKSSALILTDERDE